MNRVAIELDNGCTQVEGKDTRMVVEEWQSCFPLEQASIAQHNSAIMFISETAVEEASLRALGLDG